MPLEEVKQMKSSMDLRDELDAFTPQFQEEESKSLSISGEVFFTSRQEKAVSYRHLSSSEHMSGSPRSSKLLSDY